MDVAVTSRDRQRAVRDDRLERRLDELAVLARAVLRLAGEVAGREDDLLGLVAADEFERAAGGRILRRLHGERRAERRLEGILREIGRHRLAGFHRHAEGRIQRVGLRRVQLGDHILQVAALVRTRHAVHNHQAVELEVGLLRRRDDVPAHERLRGQRTRAFGEEPAAARRPERRLSVPDRERGGIPRAHTRLAGTGEETRHALRRGGRHGAAFDRRARFAQRHETHLRLLRIAETEPEPELMRNVAAVETETEVQRPVLRLRRARDREEVLVERRSLFAGEMQRETSVPRLLHFRAFVEERGTLREAIHLVEMDDRLRRRSKPRHGAQRRESPDAPNQTPPFNVHRLTSSVLPLMRKF